MASTIGNLKTDSLEAEKVSYDNTTSSSSATNVQGAIDNLYVVDIAGSRLTASSVAKSKLDSSVQSSLSAADTAVQPSDIQTISAETIHSLFANS